MIKDLSELRELRIVKMFMKEVRFDILWSTYQNQ